MGEEKLIPYYSKIAKVLSDMIPVEWKELMMVFFEEDGMVATGIYFRTIDGILHWADNIPMDFDVDEEIYDSIGDELYEVCKAYKNDFIKELGDEWSYMLFRLTSEMKMKVKYYYDLDPNVDIHDMMDRIFFENYKIEPKGDFSKKRLYKYLEEQKSLSE